MYRWNVPVIFNAEYFERLERDRKRYYEMLEKDKQLKYEEIEHHIKINDENREDKRQKI